MRILVYWKAWSKLSFLAYDWARNVPALARCGIGLLQCLYNERAYGSACIRSSLAQAVMERFWNVDGGTDNHDIIMSLNTEIGESHSFHAKSICPISSSEYLASISAWFRSPLLSAITPSISRHNSGS